MINPQPEPLPSMLDAYGPALMQLGMQPTGSRNFGVFDGRPLWRDPTPRPAVDLKIVGKENPQ